MSSLNLSEIAATTLRKRNKTLADNVTNHNALWRTLDQKGHIKNAAGGRTLVEPLSYAENSTVKFYDGYETFTLGEPGEVIDAAEYDWKQLGGFVAFSGKDKIRNRGKHAAVNLVESRITNLEHSLQNTAATAAYADGTGTTGKEFGGLQLLVSDDPTAAGTVGGIDQAANAFWRNQVNDLDGGGTTTSSANVTGYMNAMWLATIRGSDKVDLIAADSFMYTNYEESLQQYQRFSTSKMADAGFEALKYKSADIVYDDQCPTNHMYFLNSRYLYVQVATGRKFDVGKTRDVTNADYSVTPIWLAGNFTCSNRQRQGVIIGESD